MFKLIMNSSNIIVTGGAGFIGSHLVDDLLSQGHKLTVIDNLSTGHKDYLPLSNQKLNFINKDICDFESIEKFFEECDYVFHLATASVRESLVNPTLVHNVNATGTYNILKLASKYRVKKFLYCSSSEVNGTAKEIPMREQYHYDPETIYGASKLIGEYYTSVFHKSGWLNCTIARPHNNYGPREHHKGMNGEVIPRFIISALNNADLTIYGDGSQTRDFTYVKDTTRILYHLMFSNLDKGCEVYNVCTGEETSIKKLAETIIKKTQSNSKIKTLDSRPQDVLRLCGNNSKLSNTKIEIPQYNLESGLEQTIKWFKNKNFNLSDIEQSQFWEECTKEDFIK
jgi:UDP-glucose 4-epimerase